MRRTGAAGVLYMRALLMLSDASIYLVPAHVYIEDEVAP